MRCINFQTIKWRNWMYDRRFAMAALIIAILSFIISFNVQNETIALFLFSVAFFLWVMGAFMGLSVLWMKFYLSFKVGVILLWIFGLWLLPIIFGLGPLLWVIAASLTPRRKCPFCQALIPGNAHRCSFCASEIPLSPRTLLKTTIILDNVPSNFWSIIEEWRQQHKMSVQDIATNNKLYCRKYFLNPNLYVWVRPDNSRYILETWTGAFFTQDLEGPNKHPGKKIVNSLLRRLQKPFHLS